MKMASNLAWGCLFTASNVSFSSFAVNAANTSIGHTFWCPSAKNVSSIGLRIASKTGTVNYGEIEVKLYPVSPSTGYPDLTNVLGTTTATSTGSYAFSSTVYMNFVFSSPIALSANTQYCFLYRNLNASPASNYFSVEYAAYTRIIDGEATGIGNESRISSTNNTSWTRAAYGGNWYVIFDDNTSLGLPITWAATQSFGQTSFTFKTPKFRLKLNCLKANCVRSGTYTNTTICRISKAGTTVADSKNYYNFANYSNSSAFIPFLFDDIVLEPDTLYTATIVYTSGTSSGISMGIFGNLMNITGVTELRKQFTGDSAGGYPNGDTSNLTKFAPFILLGEIDEPVVPATIVTGSF